MELEFVTTRQRGVGYSYGWSQRFVGHDNRNTDIKEAVFMGKHDQYVVAGSDCGSAFIWERDTGRLLRVLIADEDVVNCCQPHPHELLLATSGIEDVVRLWRPNGRAGAAVTASQPAAAAGSSSSSERELAGSAAARPGGARVVMGRSGGAMRGGGSGGSACGDPFAIGDEEGLVRQAARNHRRESRSWSDDSDDEGVPDGARLAQVFASLASGSNASIRVDVLRQLLAQQHGAMYDDDDDEAGTGAGGGGVGSGPAACRQQ